MQPHYIFTAISLAITGQFTKCISFKQALNIEPTGLDHTMFFAVVLAVGGLMYLAKMSVELEYIKQLNKKRKKNGAKTGRS